MIISKTINSKSEFLYSPINFDSYIKIMYSEYQNELSELTLWTNQPLSRSTLMGILQKASFLRLL